MLEYLINGVEVDTVVMPYTDSITQFLARADSSGEEEFLNSFYKDPVGWFVSKGVRRILLIGSTSNEVFQYKGVNENITRKSGIENKSISIDPDSIIAIERIADTDIFYLDNYVQAKSMLHCWKFDFSNLKIPESDSYLHIVDEFQQEKMLSLDDIFHNKRLTKELIKRLRAIIPNGKTVNRTSVIVVHEPILENRAKAIFQLLSSNLKFITKKSDKDLDNILSFQRRISAKCKRTILTGDIEIMKDEEFPLKESIFLECAVFQCPHHGAREAIQDSRLLKNMLNIFPAGITNRYGHPDLGILREGYSFFVVNERSSFDYIISMT